MTQPHAHPVAPPSDVGVTGGVATILQRDAAVADTARVLVPLIPGASPAGIGLALSLTDHERTKHRGTRHAPRGVKLPGARGAQAREELFYRAAYVVNAAKRLSGSLTDGKTPRQALHGERPFWRAHEQARRGRAAAATAVDTWGAAYGGIVGWHGTDDDRTTPECLAASGSNFRTSQKPRIGWPGALHGGTCRCVPGPPFVTTRTVDQATAHLGSRSVG